jgi:hypothetical protein
MSMLVTGDTKRVARQTETTINILTVHIEKRHLIHPDSSANTHGTLDRFKQLW